MITKGVRTIFAACCMWLLLVVVAHAGTVSYIYTDPQGTPLAEADVSGNITATFDYKPYGSQALGNPPTGPGYTGHVNDPDTNFVYMQARYYDPAVGRFISLDPVTPKASDLYSFNRFSYAGDNPVVHTDPTGKCVDGCVAEAAAACAASTPCVAAVGLAAAYVGIKAIQAIQATADYLDKNVGADDGESGSPPLPDHPVGAVDGKSRQQGGRILSGPLAPEYGGTGNSEKDFENLTGGKSGPAPEGKNYPPGTLQGENGITHRPATEKSGPRIEVPANGDKPHETLHYDDVKDPAPPLPQPVEG